MKKTTVFCILCFAMLSLNAQEQTSAPLFKGQMLLGGSFNFTFNEFGVPDNDQFTTNRTRDITLQPGFDYFLLDDVSVGASLIYQRYKDTAGDFELEDRMTWGTAINVRKYWQLSKQFYVYGQARVPLLFSEGDYFSSSFGRVNTESFSYGIDLASGFNFFLAPWVCLEANVNLLSFSRENMEQNNEKFYSNDFYVGPNGLENIAIGVRFALR